MLHLLHLGTKVVVNRQTVSKSKCGSVTADANHKHEHRC